MNNPVPPENQDYLSMMVVPKKPSFLPWVKQTAKRYWVWLGSSSVALVIGIVIWIVPNPNVGSFLQVLLLLPVLGVVVMAGYAWAFYRYYRDVLYRLRQLRNMLLIMAGVLPTDDLTDLRFPIKGISPSDGTVQLVLDERATGIFLKGALLTVVSTNTLEEWGVVEVTAPIRGLARARVIDRTRPQFWEELEDRMKTDPSSPDGFHLEPHVLRRLQEILRGEVTWPIKR